MHSILNLRSLANLLSKLKRSALVVLVVCLAGCESIPELAQVLNTPAAGQVLSSQTIAQGLREALTVGSQNAASTLGRTDGFLASQFRIPLPDTLIQAQEVAGRFGLSGIFDEMEVRLNRAAETAVPKAQRLFVTAISQLTFDDVMTIYRGPDDAATAYLQRTTATDLRSQMRPIIEASLADVGALNTFKTLADRVNRIPLGPKIDADLTSYVLEHASRAVFQQVAVEEAAIRRNPAKRTTELLRRVFG